MADDKQSPRWRYEMQLPDEPELGDKNQRRERELDWSWFRLQIIHTPFRATDREEYLALSGWLKKLEIFFLRHPEFEDYYKECFAEETSTPAPAGPSPAIDHIASNQAHFMEEVFFSLQLDRYANAPDNRGWINLFRRWGRSLTFNRRLDQLRSTFTLGFLEFYDQYLRHYPFRIDEHPIPHRWDPKGRRKDPREAAQAPPERSGGEPGKIPVGFPEPRPKAKVPEPLLPGQFLDSGVREVQPTSEVRAIKEPGTGAHGVEDEKGGAQSYETPAEQPGGEPPTEAGPSTPNE